MYLNRRYAQMIVLGCIFLTFGGALAQSTPDYPAFPSPAPTAYGICGAVLGDGRLLIWNGDSVYMESHVGSRQFDLRASGYAGDPGFAAVAPDGQSVLLGAGYSGNLYRFDSAQPEDYAPAALAGTADHYAGTFLSDTLVLLDAGKPDFSGSELSIFDLSAGKSALRPVVRKSAKYAFSKEAIINKPPQSWSAALTVDADRDRVYAMDAQTRELRAFSVTGIINAYQSGSTLDWEADGLLIGEPERYFTGSVSGVTADGLLVIGGSSGYLMPGGVQLVNPDSGEIVNTFDPAGTQGFYTAVYNPILREITAIESGAAYLINVSPVEFRCRHFPVPAATAYGVAGTVLNTGALCAWNGNAIYVQAHPRADWFELAAEGYAGDPGFIARRPVSGTLVLGAGYSGLLYGADPQQFADYSESAVVGTVNHYAGDFISDTLLLVDAGKPDFSGSELVVFDLDSAGKTAPLPLVVKSAQYDIPKERRIIDKPPYSYSSSVCTDHTGGVVYAMDANTRELRRFSLAALNGAYATGATLDWQTDGALIGQAGAYFTGGVSGITPSGLLVIGGSEGYLLPGGIQLVDPETGEIKAVLDPARNQGFYSVIYNPAVNMLFGLVNGETWAVDLDKLGFGAEEGEGEGSVEGVFEGEGSAEGSLEGEGSAEGAVEGEGEGEQPVDYLLSLRIQGQGETAPAPGSYTYAAGTNVSLYATPAEGWNFAHWELPGGIVSTDNPLIIPVNQTLDIAAVFQENTPKSPWCCGGAPYGSAWTPGDVLLAALLGMVLSIPLRTRRQPR